MSLYLIALGVLPMLVSEPGSAQEPARDSAWPRALVERSRLPRDVSRPRLGVQLAPVDAALAAHLPDHLGAGVLLTGVFEGSPAAAAGLQLHDVIYAVDDDSDVSVKGLIQRLGEMAEGDLVVLDVTRKGRSFRATVTLRAFEPVQDKALKGFFGRLPGRSSKERSSGFAGGGLHTWPRFGVNPEGDLMMQKRDRGLWEKTEAKFPRGRQKALYEYLHRSGGSSLHADGGAVDPDGSLRRDLGLLQELYRERTPGGPGMGARVEALETKMDAMLEMLEAALESRD